MRTLTISEPENAIALVVFVVVAVVVAYVVHTSARRAERAVAAQRESAALAELTHTLLGSTDQMTVLLEHAVDMFGAERARWSAGRRPTARPRSVAEVVADATAAPDGRRGAGAPASGDWEQTHATADDEHDLVLVGAQVPADRQRLLAAFAAARRRHPPAARAPAGRRRGRGAGPRQLGPHGAASAVSHDLRTPLAGIKAAIGSLRSSEVTFSPEDEAELEAAIEDSADRLDALIGNLLDMSRLQAGALVASPRPVDLGEVVPAAVAAVTEPDRVDWSLDPAPASSSPTPACSTGCSATSSRTHCATSRRPAGCGCRRAASAAAPRCAVGDTGPGVPEEARERIFLPFQRHGDAPSGDGVGLGLAVARGLAEAMGGEVSAEETPGGGLTMVIELPSAEEDPHG